MSSLALGQKSTTIETLNLLYDKGEYKNCFKQTQNYFNQNQSSVEAKKLLANLHEKLGRYYVADSLMAEVVDGFQSQPDKKVAYAKALSDRGYILTLIDQYDLAIELLEKAKITQEETIGKEDLDYATTLDNLGLVLVELNKYEKAKDYYEEALTIKEGLIQEDDVSYIKSLNYLGELYLEDDNLKKAESYLTKAETHLDKSHPFAAVVLNNQGRLFHYLGKQEEAEIAYEKCIEIRKRTVGETHPRHARTLSNLGKIYIPLGQDKKARDLFIKSKSIYEQTLGKANASYAVVLSDIAQVSIEINDTSDTIDIEHYFKESGSIFKSLNVQKEYGISLVNLGRYYFIQKGDFKKAMPFLEQGLKIYRDKGFAEGQDYALAALYLAFCKKNLKQFDEAIWYGEESVNTWRKTLSKNHGTYIELTSILAEFYEAKGQIEKASSTYKESLSVANRRIEYIYPGFSEEGRREFLSNLSQYFGYYYSFASRYPQQFPELKIALQESLLHNKNLGLELSKKNQVHAFKSFDKDVQVQYEQWLDLRQQLSNAYQQSQEELKKNNVNLENLLEQTNQLEKKLSRVTRQFKTREDDKFKYADLVNKLSQDEVAIDFVEYEGFDGVNFSPITLCAFVTKPFSESPQLIPLVDSKLIDSLISTIPPHSEGSYIRTPVRSKQLYDLLWQPLEKELEGVKTIILSPDGVLHRIPFHALNMGNESLLLEKYDIQYYNSLREFIKDEEAQPREAKKSIALWGGIKYDEYNLEDEPVLASRGMSSDTTTITTRSSFKYLKGTEKEIKRIAKVFESTGWEIKNAKGYEATENQFYNVAGVQAPNILHLSTHGFAFNKDENSNNKKTGEAKTKTHSNPKFRTGLALANANVTWTEETTSNSQEDGILTAYEVEVLDFSNTELVILSACETGLGKTYANEGVLGLQSAFKTAGVDALMISLWKVPDAETVELMEAFYKNYLKSGDARQALRQAQLMMNEYYAPYYWAAFKLIE